MNRITAMIEKMKKQVEGRIAGGVVTAEKVAETHKALDMDIVEYCKFQEYKTLAVAEGTLTPEEGQVVYGLLGNTPEHFNGQPVHVKAVLTQLFKELLGRRLSA